MSGPPSLTISRAFVWRPSENRHHEVGNEPLVARFDRDMMGEMSDAVLQKRLPEAPWMDAARWRLPGTVPIDPSLWLMQDDAFAGQMAERDRLIRDWRDAVVTCLDAASDAAQECLDLVLDTLRGLPSDASSSK